MKCVQVGHNRILKVSEIPVQFTFCEPELTITVDYKGTGDFAKGIVLDRLIVPVIKRALNLDFDDVKACIENLDGLIDGNEDDALGVQLSPVRALLQSLLPEN